jgi:hypothetical protein
MDSECCELTGEKETPPFGIKRPVVPGGEVMKHCLVKESRPTQAMFSSEGTNSCPPNWGKNSSQSNPGF